MLFPYWEEDAADDLKIKWWAVLGVLTVAGLFLYYLSALLGTLQSGWGSDMAKSNHLMMGGTDVFPYGGAPTADPVVAVLPDHVIEVESAVNLVRATAASTGTPGPTLEATREVLITATPALLVTEVAEVDSVPVVAGVAVLSSTPYPVRWVERVTVRVISYWPGDGDEWCLDWSGRDCVSTTTSGQSWRALAGRGAACPAEWLGRGLELPGIGVVMCADTGQSFLCSGDWCQVGIISREALEAEVVEAVLMEAVG